MDIPNLDDQRNSSAEPLLAAGVNSQNQGDFVAAEQRYREVLELEPENLDALFKLAILYLKRGKKLDAVKNLQHVLRIDPHHAQAYSNLGVILAQHNRFAQAIECFEMSLQVNPGFLGAKRNLQQAVEDQARQGGDRFPTTEKFQVSLAAADIHFSDGMSLMSEGNFADAEQALQLAIQINPTHAMSHFGLGLVFHEQGELEKSLRSVEHSLLFCPNAAEVRYERARRLLQLGDFERGWPEFESRWNLVGAQVPIFSKACWDGSPLVNRTLLLHAEQGIGDVFQFVRYAGWIKEKSQGKIIVACQPSIHKILATCPGVDELVALGSEYPPYDVQAPLMSLPCILKTQLTSIPDCVPYLFPNPERLAYWKHDMDGIQGLKVGLIWQGNPAYRWDHYRSFPLEHLAPLANVPGIRWFSLQKGAAAEQIRKIANRWHVIDLDRRLDETAGAFVDTAAVMKNLDLVITADTSAVHLAGALGVPVWLAQWHVPEWRWMIGKEASPWYPTMRLFAQSRRGDWTELFQRIANELTRLVGSSDSH
jgi:tetratricopeptide (TPR) repeat protein